MAASDDTRMSAVPGATRPSFAPDYGLVDAQSGAGLLPWSWVTERLANAHNYWIGSTRPDGRPHAAPVWGLWLDDAFYFSTDPHSRKGLNLAANSHIVVHLESGDEAVILEGKVEALRDAPRFGRFADAYDAKYHVRPDAIPTAVVYELRPQVVYAWREKDFTESATRWRLPTTA